MRQSHSFGVRLTHFEPISLRSNFVLVLWSLILTSKFNVHTNSIYTAITANLTHFTDQRLASLDEGDAFGVSLDPRPSDFCILMEGLHGSQRPHGVELR